MYRKQTTSNYQKVVMSRRVDGAASHSRATSLTQMISARKTERCTENLKHPLKEKQKLTTEQRDGCPASYSLKNRHGDNKTTLFIYHVGQGR